MLSNAIAEPSRHLPGQARTEGNVTLQLQEAPPEKRSSSLCVVAAATPTWSGRGAFMLLVRTAWKWELAAPQEAPLAQRMQLCPSLPAGKGLSC